MSKQARCANLRTYAIRSVHVGTKSSQLLNAVRVVVFSSNHEGVHAILCTPNVTTRRSYSPCARYRPARTAFALFTSARYRDKAVMHSTYPFRAAMQRGVVPIWG